MILLRRCRDVQQLPCYVLDKSVLKGCLGKEWVGLELVRLMNLAKGAPSVSFSFCSKLRISLRRAAILERGKKV